MLCTYLLILTLDPAFAPGTGTPEIAGMTTREMVNVLRELSGLNLISADASAEIKFKPDNSLRTLTISLVVIPAISGVPVPGAKAGSSVNINR